MFEKKISNCNSVLLTCGLYCRRRRQSPKEQNLECPAAVTESDKPAPCKLGKCVSVDNIMYHMSDGDNQQKNIYVAAPEVVVNAMAENDHVYAEPNEPRSKVTVVESREMESGGAKVTMMICRDKRSSCQYVEPGGVAKRQTETVDNDDVEFMKGLKHGGDQHYENDKQRGVEPAGYLPMNGSPKTNSRIVTSSASDVAEENCSDESAGYEKPIESRSYETPKSHCIQYDVPRPEPVYAEIPELPIVENIYEDLDEVRKSESTA